MKENKGVYVTKKHLREQLHYDFYNTICVNPVHQFQPNIRTNVTKKTACQNVGCQFDSKKSNVICTRCGITAASRRRIETVLPSHGYFQTSRSYTEIGVGSVKALPRRKVKRVYLPETDDRGVGSADLSSFIHRRTKTWKDVSYYDHKRTSSKCVGGTVEYNIGSSLSEKLSPIVQKKSATTSPGITYKGIKNIEIGSNTVEKTYVTTTTQVENDCKIEDPLINKQLKETNEIKGDIIMIKIPEDYTIKGEKYVKNNREFRDSIEILSSDSLFQQVHDLENPSNNKRSVDLMENKLEKEYRRIFSMKSKDKKSSSEVFPPDFKKESGLKRRFEALRRGLTKKEDHRNSGVIISKESSQKSITSRKDVSINSDPPSLEGRSYSNTQIYSPIQYFEQSHAGTAKSPYGQSSHVKKDMNSSDRSILEDEGECQGVKGMFKLWGKKFNLENDYKLRTTPISSFQLEKKAEEPKSERKLDQKKDGKKYFFFKKKNKDKEKVAFKSKKKVTAGRCELKDGLMIKVEANNYQSKSDVQCYAESSRKTWLDKFLTSDVDTRKSVRVRWNNKMYATSSSTVFELMDNIYKEHSVVFKSRSDILTSESSFFKSYTQHVNFVHQEIQAWMIPKLIINNENKKKVKSVQDRRTEARVQEQKCVIDKSKAFAHKIELVLRSENLVKVSEEKSSAYLRIDIPKDFFVDSSSGEDGKTQSSDEEVYKIVEYETDSSLRGKKDELEFGDHDKNDLRFIVSVKDSKNMESKILETVIKRPTKHRDAVIQGSDVYIPKRCGVIGVGIITQRELSNAWKPILKIQDAPETSDDDSEPMIEQNIKKCEFAESYLHDYYRHWIPFGIDLFNWCVSDSHLKGSNENSITSFNNQGDGSKSCPNMYDDFQTSTSNEPCLPCGPCHPFPSISEDKISKPETRGKLGFFKKRKKDKDDSLKRVLPKDSLEVFKKRKIYACSNKSKWGIGFDCPEEIPYSVPSIQDKEAQDTLSNCPPIKKSCSKFTPAKRSKSCKKHVSLPDCDTKNDAAIKQLPRKPEGILTFKGAAGYDVCKKDSTLKRASISSKVSVVKGPDCANDCINKEHPPRTDLSKHCSPTKLILREPLPKDFDTSKCCISPSTSQQSLYRQRKRQSAGYSGPLSPITRQSPRLKSPYPDSLPRKLPCLTPRSPHPPCFNKTSQHSQTSCDKLLIKITASGGKCLDPSNMSKPSPLCPHFPPCIKTQSTQMSPTGSGCSSPRSPRKRPATIPSTPRKKKTKKKIPELKKCFTEPCSKLPSLTESDKFPWPIKNKEEQLCNDGDDVIIDALPKSASKCDKKCDLRPPNFSKRFPKVDSDENCNQDCISRPKTESVNNIPQTKPTSQPSLHSNKGRITGLYLKMNPAKKKICSKECIAWDASKELIGKSSTMREKSHKETSLTKRGNSPSTDEIREAQNIKVTDDDGNTLYERIDYTTNYTKPSHAILGDMYKASINRVATPININNIACEVNKDDLEGKSESSFFNLIEIQFKLKVRQGEKNTEVKIDNDDVNGVEAANNNSQIYLAAHNQYDTKDGISKSEKRNSKNDVSIRILIKNYKPKEKGKDDNKDFYDNIANKFQTVSTAYSDDSPENIAANTFSVHRTTVDLTSSAYNLKVEIKPSKGVLALQSTIKDPTNCLKSSESICYQFQDSKTDQENEENTFDTNLNRKSITEEVRKEIDRLVDEKIDYDEFYVKNTSLEYNKKPRSRKEKKEMLKKVFDKANESETKSKKNKEQLKDMLKLVLTSDSSANEAMAASVNDLSKNLTYGIKYTDSMNNYYLMDSPPASYDSKLNMYLTDENTDSFKSGSENEVKACMCSKFAERLNLCNFKGGCCCRPVSTKKDEETNCSIGSEKDFCVLNYKEYVDIETQHSKYTSSKINSAKISIQGDKISDFIATEPVIAKVQTSNKLCDEVTKIFFKRSFKRKITKNGRIKNFNTKPILGISDEDKIIIFDSKRNFKNETEHKNGEKTTKHCAKCINLEKVANVLQSYETKKAVLEIYAEKRLTEDGVRIVAKLPKFVFNNESDIEKFANAVEEYNGLKDLLMSVQR